MLLARRWYPRGSCLCIALFAWLAFVAEAVAQGSPTPPSIDFGNTAGTYYSAQQQFVVSICDDELISDASIVVKLNGTNVSHTVANGDASCIQHRIVTTNVTLVPGSNTLSVKACESQTKADSCATEQITVTLGAADTERPTGNVSPPSRAVTTGNQLVTFSWCDNYKVNLASTQVWLNGSPISTTTTSGTGQFGCYSAATTPVVVALQPGVNQIKAVVADSAGNLSDTLRATYTYSTPLTLVGEPRVITPQMCVAGCFDARLGYSTPAYVSLDAPRSLSFVYSSAHVYRRHLIEADLLVEPGAIPNRIGLRVLSPAGGAHELFGTTQTEVFYQAVPGVNRVSAWASIKYLPQGTYASKLEVSRYHSNVTLVDTIPLRVVSIDETGSPFGAGWSLSGYQRIVLPNSLMDTTGVTLITGDGQAAFFQKPASCATGAPCTYISPPGDYTTLVRTSGNFVRLSEGGDSTVFLLTGRLKRVVDRFGNKISYKDQTTACSTTYGCQLETITDPAGKVTTFTYTAAGTLDYLTLPSGGIVNFEVSNGDLVRVVDPDNVVALDSVTYSDRTLTSFVDRARNRTDFVYDAWGKLAQTIGPAYRAQGSSGYRDTTFYRSRELAVLPAAGTGTLSAPAAAVRADSVEVTVTDQRRRTTRVLLDRWGAAWRVRDPLGFTSTTVRDSIGNVIATTDALGNTSSIVRDGPRVTSVTTPEVTVSYEYNGPGQRLSREYSDLGETRYYYADAAHAFVLDSVHVDKVGTSRFTYDSRGRLLTQRDSSGDQTSISYEPSSWQNTATTTSPGNRVTTVLARDAWGRATQVRTPDLKVTTSVFDAVGRMTSLLAPDLGTTQYHYGIAQLDSITDAEGHRYRWTRNQLGWVESETRPGQTPLYSTYDRYGRMVTSIDRRGVTTTMAYDTLDRVVDQSAAGGGVSARFVTRAYSPVAPGVSNAPRWEMASNFESTDTLHYDDKGRQWRTVTVRPTGTKIEIERTYTPLGAQDTTRYRVNGGAWRTMRYLTNKAGDQLTGMVDFGGGLTSFRYNGEGRLTRDSVFNGPVRGYSYTSNNEVAQISYKSSTLNATAGLGFMYTGLGQVSRRSDASGMNARVFEYDPNGRIEQYTDWQRNSPTPANCTLEVDVGWVCPEDTQWTITPRRTFTYDKVGNPTDSGAVVVADNRLAQYRGLGLSYDAEGNLAGRSGRTFQWDAFGQMESVANGTAVASYGYDGFGRRIRRTRVDGDYEQYVYDGDDILLDLTDAGAVRREYTYYPGTDRAHSVLMGGSRLYYATDLQGTVLALSNAGGSVVSQYRYTPFGEPELVVDGTSDGNRIRYAGREWDADAGMYYNRARWYDPVLQRFVSQDPIGLEGGINMYAYAGNDPINASDPSGLMASCYERALSGFIEFSEKYFECPNVGIDYYLWLAPQMIASSRGGGYPGLTSGNELSVRWASVFGNPPVPGSSCDTYKCELRDPSFEEYTRVRRVLSRIRQDIAFCQQVQTAGMQMVDRQLQMYDNFVKGPNGGQIFGNAPYDPTRNGVVMYLYSKTWRDRFDEHVIVHEAVHGVAYRVDALGRPMYYPDSDNPDNRSVWTPLGTIDQAASRCLLK